jgi:hypothetical protein
VPKYEKDSLTESGVEIGGLFTGHDGRWSWWHWNGGQTRNASNAGVWYEERTNAKAALDAHHAEYEVLTPDWRDQLPVQE